MIEVRHLTKRYGGHTAVSDLSFTIDKGKVYGFLGPNGAGKSTTMNIMTGCLGATEGEVLIDGHNIMDEPMKAKRLIGYLPELPPLYMDMTPREYLRFVLQAKGVPHRDWQEQLARVMDKTRITDVQNRLIRNLSKGYRQRVGIAAALLGEPKIIILDEPTVGLDPVQVLEVRSLIRELGKNHTVILSSHILSEVQSICDDVLILAHGKLIARGTPHELAQRLTAKGSISATAQGSREDVLRAAAGVAGLQNITVTGQENGEISFTAESAAGADLRGALSQALAAAGCPVLRLSAQTASLEDVFLQLTDAAPAKEEQL